MFFLLRSAVCIGLVVAALPQPMASGRGAAQPALTSAAASAAERLCRAAPQRCLALLRDGVQAGSTSAYAALWRQASLMPSRDSLSVADRQPGWMGKAGVDAD